MIILSSISLSKLEHFKLIHTKSKDYNLARLQSNAHHTLTVLILSPGASCSLSVKGLAIPGVRTPAGELLSNPKDCFLI